MITGPYRRAAHLTALAVAGLLSGLAPLPASAESVLRIAMTAGDIPDWAGQPDQGFEGYRFVGFNLYDGLVNWDLSQSDKEAGLRPGLATKWYPDPADPKRWIFELRQDVKYHDGCPWNADSAVWNIERLTSDKSPAFSPLSCPFLPSSSASRARSSSSVATAAMRGAASAWMRAISSSMGCAASPVGFRPRQSVPGRAAPPADRSAA